MSGNRIILKRAKLTKAVEASKLLLSSIRIKTMNEAVAIFVNLIFLRNGSNWGFI